MSTHPYLHADAPFTAERERLRLLEARYDAETLRRLRVAGLLAGAWCLEVGAGAGSIARILAAEVGPAGWVVVTDADPRFLADLAEANGGPTIEVRQHDILVDDLEESAFDLVHCRALLLHLAEPERALARMAAALRPKGCLLVEDADYSSFGAAEPDHPSAALFGRVTRAVLGGYLGRAHMDPWFGRRLPTLVDGLALEARGDEALAFRRAGGSVEAQLFIRSFELMREGIVRKGVATPADLDGVLAALADPTFAFVDSLNIAAWGRRPAPAFLG